MSYILFIKVFFAGFLLSMPIGPVNLLCIRRTLNGGWTAGFVSGLGAATADTLYSFIAAFGVSFIMDFLMMEKTYFQIAGGLFLCYLGVHTYRLAPKEKNAAQVGRGMARAYAMALFLTLSNPASILALMALFAGVGIVSQSSDLSSSILLALGIFSGSTLWWLTLCGIVNLFRNKFTSHGVRWLNRISGVIITAFGIFTLVYLL